MSSTRAPRLDEIRTSGTDPVGATFQLGRNGSATSTASKNVLRSALLRVVAYRPHMGSTVRRDNPAPQPATPPFR
ncbi:hypothetical protein Acsp01_38640 [Actinoplanes sp. NBRC 101535]|nr:hypothetical protein Acsp01_38640 [Actinoplanes sp. NBRC 101535]